MFKGWGRPANRHATAIQNAFYYLGVQDPGEQADVLSTTQKILRNLGDEPNLKSREAQERLRGWVRASFDDLPDSLKNDPDAERTVDYLYRFISKVKRLWNNIEEHPVPAGLQPIDPPDWAALPFPAGPRVPPGSGTPPPPPSPPPTNIVQDNSKIEWGRLVPQEDYQFIGLDSTHAQALIDEKTRNWNTRLDAYRQRVVNAQATLAANPARCPPATHRYFDRLIKEVIQDWNSWIHACGKWYRNWWRAVKHATEQREVSQLDPLKLNEEMLIHKSNWIMEEQLYQWENVPSQAERQERLAWIEWGFNFNSPLIRYDVFIDVFSRHDRLMTRVNLHHLLSNPKSNKYKCPGRLWVKAESLRVSALIGVLKETGFMQEGDHLMFYQWKPTRDTQEIKITHDMDFQVEIMNHMKANHPILCGRQTLNERARPVDPANLPHYALRIASESAAAGNTAKVTAKTPYDLRKRVKDIADFEEREGILKLFEGPLTPEPLTAEDKKEMAEALEEGRAEDASGSAVAGPSGTHAVEPTKPGTFVPEKASKKRDRKDDKDDGSDPMEVDDSGSDPASKRQKKS